MHIAYAHIYIYIEYSHDINRILLCELYTSVRATDFHRQVMGAAVMAIPAGALGNAFSEVVEKEMNDEDRGLRADGKDRGTGIELGKVWESGRKPPVMRILHMIWYVYVFF